MSFLAELFHQLDRVVCTENQESQRSQMAQWEIEKERERGVVVKSAIWQLYNQRHQTPCSTTRIQQGSECSERYFPTQWWDIFNFADSYEWAPCMGKKKIWRSSQSDWAPYLDMALCPWSPAPSVVYRKTTRPIWWWSGRTRRLQGPSTWSGIWHLEGKWEESM